MVTKRRGSSTPEPGGQKRLRGTSDATPVNIYSDIATRTAKEQEETPHDYHNHSHVENHAQRLDCSRSDDETISTTSVDTAEPGTAYSNRNNGYVQFTSSGWQCSICNNDITPPAPPRRARVLIPTERLLLDKGHQTPTSTVIPSKEFYESTDVVPPQLIHHDIGNPDAIASVEADMDTESSCDGGDDDNVSSGSHRPGVISRAASLESSPILDRRRFMTIVDDDEVPSSYVDFALFMMERGTLLFQWVQNAKERLEALQARLTALEAQQPERLPIDVL